MARDTDTDWRQIADAEPFYGVLTHARFLRANLTDETLAEFWRSGDSDIGLILTALRDCTGDFSPESALDFGCGVGRLTNAMALHAANVRGVDVSPAMVEEARRHARPNIVFSDDIGIGPYDWVNSRIVFQHIHPSIGFGLLERLLATVTPGGRISIQLTVYKNEEGLGVAIPCIGAAAWDGERLRNLRDRPLPVGTMMMYDYDLTRVLMLLNAAGFLRITLDHTDHGGNHGVTIYGRRVPT